MADTKEHLMTFGCCHRRRMIDKRAVITVGVEFGLRPRSRKTDEHLLQNRSNQKNGGFIKLSKNSSSCP